jgi:hypothetical protein
MMPDSDRVYVNITALTHIHLFTSIHTFLLFVGIISVFFAAKCIPSTQFVLIAEVMIHYGDPNQQMHTNL